jgi:hypothetical protein
LWVEGKLRVRQMRLEALLKLYHRLLKTGEVNLEAPA